MQLWLLLLQTCFMSIILADHEGRVGRLRGLHHAPRLLDPALVAFYAEEYKRYNVTSRILRRPAMALGPGAGCVPDTDGSSAAHQPHAQYGHSHHGRHSQSQPHSHSLHYNFSVPLPQRLAGLTYTGHAARLRLVLQRMRRGEAVVVGGLGGSITAGQGVGLSWVHTYLGHLARWVNAAMPPHNEEGEEGEGGCAPNPSHTGPQDGSSNNGGNGGNGGNAAGAGRRGSRALQMDTDVVAVSATASAAATMAGGAPATLGAAAPAVTAGTAAAGEVAPRLRLSHVVHSGAIPGTQSSYVSACVGQHLPPAVDLVLVEFAVNDSPKPSQYYQDPGRRAFERLLRKLLRLPSAPAVLLVNMFAYNVPAPEGRGCCNFWNNAERDFDELAHYYGLPAVSLKAAVFGLVRTNSSEALSAGAIFNAGRYHPGAGGHVVVLELIITLMQELVAADSRLVRSMARHNLLQQQQQQQQQGSQGRAQADRDHSTEAEAEAAAAASLRSVFEAEAARPLPPPLSADNWEPASSTCYIQEAFPAVVVQPVSGWSWTDEGRGKWGYVAAEAGRELRIRVRTQVAGTRREGGDVVAQLVYLRGYDGMGSARLECEAGCSCAPAAIHAYSGERQVSVAATEDFRVSQAAECTLLITTTGPALPAPAGAVAGRGRAAAAGGRSFGAPGSKFKVMGILLGEDPTGAHGLVDAWLRPESLAAAEAAKKATAAGEVAAAG